MHIYMPSAGKGRYAWAYIYAFRVQRVKLLSRSKFRVLESFYHQARSSKILIADIL